MKVIKNGRSLGYLKECKCGNCNSIIEVNSEDVKRRPYQSWSNIKQKWEDDYLSRYYECFDCPICGCEIDATKGISVERGE